MTASVQAKPQNRDLGMVMREVEEDLAIFLGIRNVEMEKNDHLLVEESHHFDDDDDMKCAEPQPHSLLETCLVKADDNFLDLEMERSDHDWLIKQPDESLLPSSDADTQDSAASKTKVSNGEDKEIPLKYELDVHVITASQSEISSPLATSASAECCTTVNRRLSSSDEGKPRRSRAATPTARPSLAAKSRPSRASTPTSRATLLPSSKPVAAQPRSSTPVRPTPRSSTPASRPSIPIVSKSGSKSATPTRKPATVTASDRSSSGKKIGSTVLKSRPSQDADQNLMVAMPKRPASASRGRVSSHSSSSSSNEKPRQKSCSPARVRAPISTAHKTGNKILPRSRGYNMGGDDDVNPVVMGTKMVDRVVNMRKLAPPKQDERDSQENLRKSSQENSGFGRSLSKKSLEMAIRHMDIRPRASQKSRTSASASVHGIQSNCAKISTTATPESPQTSNSDSSKSSSCRSSYFLNGVEMDDSTS